MDTLSPLRGGKCKCDEVYASGHGYNGFGCKITFVVRLLKDQGRVLVPSAWFD